MGQTHDSDKPARFSAIARASAQHILDACFKPGEYDLSPPLLSKRFVDLVSAHQIAPVLCACLDKSVLRQEIEIALVKAHGIDVDEDCHNTIASVVARIYEALDKAVERDNIQTKRRIELHQKIGKAFDHAGIQHIGLKGIALAPLLYPDVTWRPCCDMDILIDKNQLLEIKLAVREVGFSLPDQQHTAFLLQNHHLPNAEYHYSDGNKISLELHTDAINRDLKESICMSDVSQIIPVTHNNYAYDALGHAQQLLHLTRHLCSAGRVEPLECGLDGHIVKLINMIDIVLYVERFYNEIDWETINRDQPYLINALALIHPIIAFDQQIRLPEFDLSNVPEYLPGQGRSMQGVSIVLNTTLPFHRRIYALLNPSDWWLRLKYGIKPTGSLSLTKWVTHPLELVRLFTRRMFSMALSKNAIH